MGCGLQQQWSGRISEKATFEQRPEGSEPWGHLGSVQAEGTASAKLLWMKQTRLGKAARRPVWLEQSDQGGGVSDGRDYVGCGEDLGL